MSLKLRRVSSLVLLLVAGLLAYGLLVSIPRQMVVPIEFPVEVSPADVGLAYEEFQLQPEDVDLTLQGWWMPAPEPRASLVFIHGKGSHRASDFFGSLKFYRVLVEQGISVATIDLRNHGNSGIDPRGVQWGRTEQYDALAAARWVGDRAGDLPLFLMGISMGGATVIHAMTTDSSDVDGAILLDPLLDSMDAITQGGWVESGLSPSLFLPSAWVATRFFGIPVGEQGSLELAKTLRLPVLLLQDPAAPVTRSAFARELAAANPLVEIWEAPAAEADHPELVWRERWGSHVAAFVLFPEEVLEQILGFIDNVSQHP